ncbi:MAG: MopE-related protein, partial [Myxococcaceae bacterium]
MLRKSGLAGLCALALYGCTPGKPREGAVLVVVTLEPKVRASCLVVEAGVPGGPALEDVRIAASEAQREYKVAVVRGELPAEIGLRARALWGVGCTEPLTGTGASEEKRSGFPVGTISTVTLSIAAPPAADDADGDGFVADTRGGLDCLDTDASVNPAAAEACSDLRDLNCNGLSGCADPVCQAQSCAEPGTTLAFVNPPHTLLAGQCSGEVTVEVRNSGSLAAQVAADTQVTFAAAPAAGFGFFTDPACQVPGDVVTVPARGTRATLYLRGEAAGDVVVTASAQGLSPAVQTEIITAGQVVKLAFVSPPRTVVAGECSSALTVETQDTFGNGVVVATAAPLTLTALPPTGVAFFRQPDCTVAVTGLSVAAGARRATYYFNSSTAGTVTMSAASSPLTAATQDQTVTAGPPTVLAFTNPPRTAVAGACSGALTVQVRDGLANPAPVATATTLGLAGTPSGSFTFFTDPACAAPAVVSVGLAAGQSAASFYFRGQVAVVGSVEVSAGGFTPVPQAATITPGTASALGFVTAAQGVQAGQCSGIVTLRSQDGFGNAANVAASTQVNLTVSPSAGFAFYSDPGCNTVATFVTLLPTSPTASFYFQGTAPVSHTVTAQAAGLGSATQVESLGVGAATKVVFLTAEQALPAGGCSGLVVVQTQDVAGNPSNVTANKTVNLTAAPATGFLFYSDPTCATAVTSRVIAADSASQSFYFRGTRAGPVTVTAAIGGFTSGIQVETVNVLPPNELVFTTGAQSRVAGICSALATLEVRDSFGNVSPVAAGATVGLTAAPSTGFLFYSDATCVTAVTGVPIAPNGSTAGFYFRGTATGAVVVTAAATGLGSVGQTETVTPAAAFRLTFLSAAQTLTAGDCSGPVTVRALDSFGNPSPVSGATTVTFTGGVSFYNNSTCTAADDTVSIPNGGTTSAPAMYFSSTAAGSVAVTASAPLLAAATQTEVIEPDVPSALAFTTLPQTLNAGACSAAATVEVQDSFGNPSPVSGGSTVSLLALAAGFGTYSNPGCTTAVGSVPVPPGGTTASFYFRGTLPGPVNLTATSVEGSDSQVETIQVGPPSRVVFVNGPMRQTLGLCSSELTLETQDAVGNVSPVGAATLLNLGAAPPRVSFYSEASCTTAASDVTVALGASTAGFWFKGTAVGSSTVNVSDPLGGLLPAVQVETVTGAPAALVFTSPPQVLRAGQCSAEVTVEAQ